MHIRVKTAILCIILLLGFFGCSGLIPSVYQNSSVPFTVGPSSSIVYIPLKTLTTRYFDNTRISPEIQYSDSFFLAVTSGLVPYELARRFSLCQVSPETLDSLAKQFGTGPSKIYPHNKSDSTFSVKIKEIALVCAANYVAIPYATTITHKVFQPTSWRNSGGVYERPVSYTAHTVFCLQIWNAAGVLVYESVGKSSTGKPILYSLLKKEKPKTDDLAAFSRQFYAPPVIKSLARSIKNSMPMR